MSKGITVEIFASWWGYSTSQVFATFPYLNPKFTHLSGRSESCFARSSILYGLKPQKAENARSAHPKKGSACDSGGTQEMVEISGATF